LVLDIAQCAVVTSIEVVRRGRSDFLQKCRVDLIRDSDSDKTNAKALDDGDLGGQLVLIVCWNTVGQENDHLRDTSARAILGVCKNLTGPVETTGRVCVLSLVLQGKDCSVLLRLCSVLVEVPLKVTFLTKVDACDVGAVRPDADLVNEGRNEVEHEHPVVLASRLPVRGVRISDTARVVDAKHDVSLAHNHWFWLSCRLLTEYCSNAHKY